jgi:hypothetical protein
MDEGQEKANQVLATFRKLDRVIQAASEHQESREHVDLQTRREGIDLVHVMNLVATGQFVALRPLEARYLVGTCLQRDPVAIDRLMEAHPRLWKKFLRKLLMEWFSSIESPSLWSQFAEVAQKAPVNLKVVGGPVAVAELVRADGAERAAYATTAISLESCYRTLTESWGYGRSWGLTAAVSLAWLQNMAQSKDDFNSAVRFLTTDQAGSALRSLLLPEQVSPMGSSPTATSRAHGSDIARQHGVAELLKQRFIDKNIAEREFFLLEPYLIRGRFGDPRLVNVNDGWQNIKIREPKAYNSFLESLIREDLAFFFQHSMKEADRERFWLRYVGSIRRTICVLDPTIHQEISRKVVTSTLEIKAAFDRAIRARKSSQTHPNAFCLLFDNLAIVEFSVTGNACYIYERELFNKKIAPGLIVEKMKSVTDLKRPNEMIDKISHIGRWTDEMGRFLRSYGHYPIL